MLALASCAPDTVDSPASHTTAASSSAGSHVGGAGSGGSGGSSGGAGTFIPPSSNTTPTIAGSSASAGVAGAAGTLAAIGGSAASAGRPATGGTGGSAGALAGSGKAGASGAPTTAAAGSSSTGPIADSDTDMLREACVAEINMYRAMRSDAPPLKRATPAQEACSDMGTKSDGDSMAAHGFFRMGAPCLAQTGLSAQDSCPGYPVGGFGSPTVLDALKVCLKQMWAEGEPPEGRDACTADATGCFEKYGHWLNMSNPKATAVSCSFYKMKDGKSWWMSQDFVISWR